ncbi:MAG: type VI secretion system baseplate subunit TssF [Thermodesulfobacteriota bacterium]
MINRYYQQELAYLKDLAAEFAQAHPALASMLSGASQDPDVERLLEGTAFLTGLLRQKLDDEFPEVIHGLIRLIFPHYLRPIPSTAISVFKPKPSLIETLRVPAGTALASKPVDGTKCTFRTCYDVDVHPLKLTKAELVERPGRPAFVILGFQLTGLPLNNWKADYIRLHLAGAYPEAANIFQLFLRQVRDIEVRPTEGGSPLNLHPAAITPVGFQPAEALFPYPAHSFPGYRVLQEYFILPQKFLFFDLTGLEAWRNRGPGFSFEVTFEMKDLPEIRPQIRPENFVLFATPVVNLFPHEADPVALDHRQPEYHVLPSGGRPDHFQIYSVENVSAFAPGTVEKRDYVPFELFSPQADAVPVYHVNRRLSPIRPVVEVFLAVAYPPAAGPPAPETLSIQLMCTNAALPESLKYGDITEPTSSSPELCEFTNILPPTAMVQPPLGSNLLWRFLSHLSLNLLSLADTGNLKALLRLYIFPEGRDKATIVANEKRIEGLAGVSVKPFDRLVRGLTLRGQEITLKVIPDHFASRGDMLLFGSVMDHFLGTYANINSFTILKVIDALKGDVYPWPARIGDRPLI